MPETKKVKLNTQGFVKCNATLRLGDEVLICTKKQHPGREGHINHPGGEWNYHSVVVPGTDEKLLWEDSWPGASPHVDLELHYVAVQIDDHWYVKRDGVAVAGFWCSHPWPEGAAKREAEFLNDTPPTAKAWSQLLDEHHRYRTALKKIASPLGDDADAWTHEAWNRRRIQLATEALEDDRG